MTMPADLKAKVLASVLETRPQPRRWWGPTALFVIPTSAAVAISLFVATDGLHHGAGRPAWVLVSTVLGWVAVAALATWLAFDRGRSAVGRARVWLLVTALATPALLFVIALVWSESLPDLAAWWPERLGLKCFGLTLAMAAWPLVGMALVRRGSDPVHPGVTGAALGAASGAWAGVVVDVWCPVMHPAHVAIGHILPIVILSLFGLALGRRVIAMRSRDD
jgi:hypothetical protein